MNKMPDQLGLILHMTKQTVIRYVYSMVIVSLFMMGMGEMASVSKVTIYGVFTIVWGGVILWLGLRREIVDALRKQDELVTLAAFFLSIQRKEVTINKTVGIAAIYNCICYLPVFLSFSLILTGMNIALTLILFMGFTVIYWFYQYQYLVEENKKDDKKITND